MSKLFFCAFIPFLNEGLPYGNRISLYQLLLDAMPYVSPLAFAYILFGIYKVLEVRNDSAATGDVKVYWPLEELLHHPSGWKKLERIVLFRILPPVIVLVLEAALLTKYHYYDQLLWDLLGTVVIFEVIILFPFILKRECISCSHWVFIVVYLVIAKLVFLLTIYIDIDILAPKLSDIVNGLWSSLLTAAIVVLYIRRIQEKKKDTATTSDSRLDDMCVRRMLSSFNRIRYSYGIQIEKACQNNSTSLTLLYAILIYESLNRPLPIRKIENLWVKITRCTATVGIAQVKSNVPLTDVQSIEKAAKILEKSEINNAGSDWDSLIYRYNSSKKYVQNIWKIITVLESRAHF